MVCARVIGLGVVTAIALTGCAPRTSDGVAASASSATVTSATVASTTTLITTTTTTAATTTTTSTSTTVAPTTTTTTTLVPGPSVVAAAHVDDVRTDDPQSTTHILTPQITDFEAINPVIRSWVAAQQHRFTRESQAVRVALQHEQGEWERAQLARESTEMATTGSTVPRGPMPGADAAPSTFAVSWQPLHTPDDWVGVRLEARFGYFTGGELRSRTFYANRAGTVVSGAGWIDATHQAGVAGGVMSRLPEGAPVPPDLAPYEVLGDFSVTGPDRVEFRIPTVGQGPPVTVALTITELEQWWSPVGRAVVLGDKMPTPGPTPACESERCVSLTYDDGPSIHTPRLLDDLAQTGVTASFFVIGRLVERSPDTVRTAYSNGHDVGNHTWSHPDLRHIRSGAAREQIERATDVITAVLDARPTLFRPPFGGYNSRVRALGVPLIMWSVDTRDWSHRDPLRIVDSVVTTVAPGDIVLMHDSHAASVDATPWLIAELQSQQLRPVPLSQLGIDFQPGGVYFSRTRHRAPPAVATTTTEATQPLTPPSTSAP